MFVRSNPEELIALIRERQLRLRQEAYKHHLLRLAAEPPRRRWFSWRWRTSEQTVNLSATASPMPKLEPVDPVMVIPDPPTRVYPVTSASLFQPGARMTPASDYLVRLAQQVVQPYTQLPSARAAMVTGSAAKGLSDYYSDLDLTIYYADELPSEETLHQIRQQQGGGNRKWLLGNRAEQAIAEGFDLHGIEVQIGHTTIAAWEAEIKQVLEKLDCTSPAQKALEGTLACQALFGQSYIDEWKRQLHFYPLALAEAMVKKHLAFFPVWGLEPHFRTRDATVWYYQILVEAAQNIVGVLAGLNRLYFTTFQFKRMHRFLDQMEIAPPDLATRLERLFQAELPQALLELENLVTETIALVERYMPSIDTSTAKRRLGWRQQSWQPVVEL